MRRCLLCANGQEPDYKRPDSLFPFLNRRHGLIGARQSGLCRRHQAAVALMVKRARQMALLPYASPRLLPRPGEKRPKSKKLAK